MSPEEKYIRKLEHSLWLLKSSKSYRLTYPFRKAEEVLHAAARLPGALCQYARPGFRQSFDARSYLSSSARPHGWWRNFPALHYCLFHENDYEDHGKYDALDPAKPTVILVTHQVCRTGAPILVLDLLNRFARSHNVVVFSIGGGALLPLFQEQATVFVGPIARSNLDEVLDREFRLLKTKCVPDFAIVNSIEATEALEELWHHDIAALHLVHEFATYTRPRTRMEKSACFSSGMVFSADLVRASAMDAFPQIGDLERNVLPQGICALPEGTASDEERARERAGIKAAFRPQGWPDDTIVVLGAGTVQLRKGIQMFISCAKKVVESAPTIPVRFVWIGSGFDPENDLNFSCFLDEQIKRSGLGDSFSLLDEVNELQCAYDSADIFFLSSQLDPLPLVAQDALFNRLPLVCFEGASGIPEHIRDDPDASSGVVPYLDVDAAAKKILEFAADAGLRMKAGEAGRRLANRIFDQTEYFGHLMRIGGRAAEAMRQEIQDREVIRDSGILDVAFAYPRLAEKNEDDLALKFYTTSWKNGIHRRKPLPGFHPGIYADCNPGISRDPLAHYIRAGKPAGPWMSEVIEPAPASSPANPPVSLKVALHIHLHYPDRADTIFSRLKAAESTPDLFLSVNSRSAKNEIQEKLEQFGLKALALRVFPNRGRDIGPLITGFRELFDGDYDLIGHVHGKKSVQLDKEFASQWAAYLYENLLGGKYPMMQAIINRMSDDRTIGLIFPDDPNVISWDDNWEHARDLCIKMGISESPPTGCVNFPVGTMFWSRTRALKALADLNLGWDDYPEEPLPHDGTILHAIERLLPIVTSKAGFRTSVSHAPGFSR